MRIKICVVYSRLQTSCRFCKTQCQHVAGSWVWRESIYPVYSMCSTNEHCHSCHKHERWGMFPKSMSWRRLNVQSPSCLHQPCFVRDILPYELFWQNGGLWWKPNKCVYSKQPIGKECANHYCRVPSILFSPLGPRALSCSPLPGSTGKCLA